MKNRKLWVCLSLTLMILALFAVSAAAVCPEELTLEMLVEANSHEKLMESCSSYYIHYDYNGEYSGSTYADSELIYDYILDSVTVHGPGMYPGL